jgi:hypothetical protein
MPDADKNLSDELLLSEMARAIWETELGDYDERQS